MALWARSKDASPAQMPAHQPCPDACPSDSATVKRHCAGPRPVPAPLGPRQHVTASEDRCQQCPGLSWGPPKQRACQSVGVLILVRVKFNMQLLVKYVLFATDTQKFAYILARAHTHVSSWIRSHALLRCPRPATPPPARPIRRRPACP